MITFYCLGQCHNEAMEGYWLCADCAKENGGDALELKDGLYPTPDVFLLGSTAKK
jgi:hypothetical protein